MDGRVWEALHVAHAIDLSADFDLVHNQLDWLPLAFAGQWGAPMVTTIHGFSGAGILPAYRARRVGVRVDLGCRPLPRAGLRGDRAPRHRHDRVRPIPLRPGDDLVVFGRIHPDKGIADAIEIARRADRRLVICGIVQDAAYFAERIEPAHRRRPRRVPRFGRTRRAGRGAGHGGRAAASDPLRRAVRPVGRRGHGHAEHPSSPTGAARCPRSSTRASPDSPSTVSTKPSRPCPARRRWTARSCRSRARERFDVERMVDGYLEVYERVLRHAGGLA